MKKAVLFFSLLSFLILIFSCKNTENKQQANALQGDLIIFHAGSLSVPFRLIAKEFEKENPGVHVLLESAGSVASARKITDLNKRCDIMASADYQVIDRFLIPGYTSWNLIFAANEMAIAYTDEAKYGDKIDAENWYKILAKPDVVFGRSDPNSDPCGYRSVMTTQLAALKNHDPALLDILKKDQNFIRPKEVDLLGMLEANAIDYIYIYKSVAIQHKLNYLSLNDSINLSKPELKEWYAKAEVNIAGKTPGEKILMKGNPMAYGICRLKNAPNPKVADSFLKYFFTKTGGLKIIEEQGQKILIPSPTKSFKHLPANLKKYAKEVTKPF